MSADQQKKLESFIETLLNTFSGFLVSYCVWKFVLADLITKEYLSINDSTIIVLVFTVLSIARGYFWRRFFAQGSHKQAKRIAAAWFRR